MTAAISAELVDCTPLIQTLRFVKSEAELAIIRKVCAIGSSAFARAPDLFCVGQPLSDAFRAFKIALLEEGAEDVPYLVGGVVAVLIAAFSRNLLLTIFGSMLVFFLWRWWLFG